jgi:hypothetical protein
LRALKKQVAARLGYIWQGGLLAAFDYFIGKGQIPVTRDILSDPLSGLKKSLKQ